MVSQAVKRNEECWLLDSSTWMNVPFLQLVLARIPGRRKEMSINLLEKQQSESTALAFLLMMA
jgi:hypothetical protein